MGNPDLQKLFAALEKCIVQDATEPTRKALNVTQVLTTVELPVGARRELLSVFEAQGDGTFKINLAFPAEA